VVFVFDRLLDSRPLDPDAGTPAAAAMVTAASAAGAHTAVMSNAEYDSTGAPGLFVAPAFGRPGADGPSLLVSGIPALPASSTITTTLDATLVRAKDGHTSFVDSRGLLNHGAVTFSTAPLSVSVPDVPTQPLPADAGACDTPPTTVALDATPTITFNSPVDLDTLMKAVTVTSGGMDLAFTLKTTDNLTFSVVSAGKDAKWPPNTTIKVTVSDAVTDQAGDMLGNGGSVTFTTGGE
jgi:hypothetical protein